MKSKFTEVKFESIIALGLIIIAVIIFYSTFSMKSLALDPVGPALIPRIIAILLGGLSVIELIRTFKAPIQTDNKNQETNWIRRNSASISIGIIFLYILSLKSLGFIVSSTIFLFVQIWLCYGRASKKQLFKITIISIVSSTVIYFVFSKWFALNLPVGILG